MIDFGEFKDQVKRQSDIVAIIGEYVPTLKRAGKSYKGLCPFHQEDTPSFNVSPADQFFHCFGCNAGGDVINFIERIESVDFKDAVTLLAERQGISIPKFTRGGDNKPRPGREFKDALFQLHELAQGLFEAEWRKDGKAREYCQRRGLDDAAVRRFGIGYAPDQWDAFRNLARSKGFSDKQLIAAGLCAESSKGDGCYDRFRGRLTFPIRDQRDRIIGFGGRILQKKRDDEPKYINSPESPIYEKGRQLYALNWAGRAIRESECALLCEGYVDAIALHQFGFTNAAATLGTAMTEEHGRMLQHICRKVVLLYDGDEAGQKAMQRIVEILLPLGLAIRVVTFGVEDDPDTFLRSQGPEAMRLRLGEAQDYLDFFLRTAARSHDLKDAQGKAAVVEHAAPLLDRIADPIIRQDAIRRLSEFIGVNQQTVVASLQRLRKPSRRAVVSHEVAGLMRPREPSGDEISVMQWAIQRADMRRFMAGHLTTEWIQNEHARFWIEEAIHRETQGAPVDVEALLNLESYEEDCRPSETDLAFLRRHMLEAEPCPHPEGSPKTEAVFFDILNKLDIDFDQTYIDDLKGQIKEAERQGVSGTQDFHRDYHERRRQLQEKKAARYKPNQALRK
ncbi:DNA primase [Candidatus Sumerlaeota bacterium]|nr:DNA primase [Candidatus Sumerlaeota bacterium]